MTRRPSTAPGYLTRRADPGSATGAGTSPFRYWIRGTSWIRAGLAVFVRTLLGRYVRNPNSYSTLSFASRTTLPHFFDLGLDARAEFLRLVGNRHKAERGEFLLHVRLRDRLGDLLLQELHDLLRRAGGRHQAGERVGVLILDPLLGEGRDLRHGCGALRRRHAEHAQLAVLHGGQGLAAAP